MGNEGVMGSLSAASGAPYSSPSALAMITLAEGYATIDGPVGWSAAAVGDAGGEMCKEEEPSTCRKAGLISLIKGWSSSSVGDKVGSAKQVLTGLSNRPLTDIVGSLETISGS